MPRLFSYGSLQLEHVQLATFGRTFAGAPGALVGFELIPAGSGTTPHANVVASGLVASRVAGTVFDITDTELAAADEYERRDGYVRIVGRLASGEQTWVYIDARSAREN